MHQWADLDTCYCSSNGHVFSKNKPDLILAMVLMSYMQTHLEICMAISFERMYLPQHVSPNKGSTNPTRPRGHLVVAVTHSTQSLC